jgi:hypothetical protein
MKTTERRGRKHWATPTSKLVAVLEITSSMSRPKHPPDLQGRQIPENDSDLPV